MFSLKLLQKTLGPLFMDGIQLSQGYTTQPLRVDSLLSTTWSPGLPGTH